MNNLFTNHFFTHSIKQHNLINQISTSDNLIINSSTSSESVIPFKQSTYFITELQEEPIKQNVKSETGKQVPGSISFVPSVAGLIIAGEVIKDIIK